MNKNEQDDSELDIFEDICNKIGLYYISDLRHNIDLASHAIRKIDLTKYPQRQIDDLAHYLFRMTGDQLKALIESGDF